MVKGAKSLAAVAAIAIIAVVASAWPAHAFEPRATVTTTTLALHQGRLTLTFARRTYALLTNSTHGALPDTRTLTPITPGAGGATGVFRFPLRRGHVDPVGLTGAASSSGGIRFDSISHDPTLGQSSTVQFSLTSFALDLSTTPAELTATFLGKSTYHDIPIASLDTTGAQHQVHRGSIAITGMRLKLLAAGVELFNQQAFNNEHRRFRIGQTVGTVALTGGR